MNWLELMATDAIWTAGTALAKLAAKLNKWAAKRMKTRLVEPGQGVDFDLCDNAE